jgi:hypothetical protein
MARPSKVTEAQRKAIASRVAYGEKIEVLMKEYGFKSKKRIEQIALEYGVKKNANVPLVEEFIDNCEKNQAIIQSVHEQGGEVGEYTFMEVVKKRLQVAKLTPVINNINELLEKVSGSRVVYDKLGMGDGIQRMDAREVGIQDSKNVKDIVEAAASFSVLVGATQPQSANNINISAVSGVHNTTQKHYTTDDIEQQLKSEGLSNILNIETLCK